MALEADGPDGGRDASMILAAVLLSAPEARAQAQVTAATQQGGAVVRLTRDEAVRLAIENNAGLAANRLDPAISAERVAEAEAPTCRTCRRRCCETASRVPRRTCSLAIRR